MFTYDFENRLTNLSTVYDGDGNRVARGTTQYLVEDLNPTGYA